ncbi:SubName: Full=Uncharacterized protein {ECO:0000313/EMBL:CCA70572.1} [Serendipita indica DSM 11827]|nr:SubName: Full=Uncharacterized protein {ECO:0000313/EMBL:CCA70572.1} [Serendipita indica DSM 11827]
MFPSPHHVQFLPDWSPDGVHCAYILFPTDGYPTLLTPFDVHVSDYDDSQHLAMSTMPSTQQPFVASGESDHSLAPVVPGLLFEPSFTQTNDGDSSVHILSQMPELDGVGYFSMHMPHFRNAQPYEPTTLRGKLPQTLHTGSTPDEEYARTPDFFPADISGERMFQNVSFATPPRPGNSFTPDAKVIQGGTYASDSVTSPEDFADIDRSGEVLSHVEPQAMGPLTEPPSQGRFHSNSTKNQPPLTMESDFVTRIMQVLTPDDRDLVKDIVGAPWYRNKKDEQILGRYRERLRKLPSGGTSASVFSLFIIRGRKNRCTICEALGEDWEGDCCLDRTLGHVREHFNWYPVDGYSCETKKREVERVRKINSKPLNCKACGRRYTYQNEARHKRTCMGIQVLAKEVIPRKAPKGKRTARVPPSPDS